MVMRPEENDVLAYHLSYPIDSFICPLCKEMMTDPVAVFCGHSFERNAIQEYFGRGEKHCPTCREELWSLDLTPNVNLRSSIEEWKRRDMEIRFEAAVSGMNSNSNDNGCKSKALEDLQVLLETPLYVVKASEEGLIPQFVESLKDKSLSSKAAMKCIYCLAKSSDDQKRAIIEAGALRRVVKQIGKAEREADAIAILLELSKVEALAENIGNMRDCIPLLVSLISNDNPDISMKVQNVLQNLSSNTHFVVKMAECGYFLPFVARFNQGPQETRALMAAALIKMQLKDNNIKELKDKQFVHNLIQMLSSNSPAYRSASLKCMKKLIEYRQMLKLFLSDPATVSLLLGLISFVTSDPHLKQGAAEILALVIVACELSEFQTCQELQELHSEHNVNLFLQFSTNSDPQTKVHFLHLLVELCNKSETARGLIRNNADAIHRLFLSLDGDQVAVKKLTMRLINCISEGHPAGVPLPPSPIKETTISTLVVIMTRSPDVQERSLAAGIISYLPKDDATIDEVLRKSETLKAIQEVISTADEEYDGFRQSVNQDKSLLENALAALLHFTEPTKPDLQRQLGKLEIYPSLVRLLSTGSSIAKQRTATALAQLSKSTNLSISDVSVVVKQSKDSVPLISVASFFPNMSWCCTASAVDESLCSVHGSACSQRHTFCLVKADAVKPLVRTLSEKDSAVTEAALMALETLLANDIASSDAAAVIVQNDGLVAILEVMEKGSLSAKEKAIDLFQKILTHAESTDIDELLFQRAERILIQSLHEDKLKKRAALVLRQMNLIPDQSSYF